MYQHDMRYIIMLYTLQDYTAHSLFADTTVALVVNLKCDQRALLLTRVLSSQCVLQHKLERLEL
jgi:hypothetical protein